MEWLAATPVFAVAAAVLFVPGVAIGLSLRVRGLLLWAVAPTVSVAVLTIAATLCGFLSVAWTPASALVALAAISLVAVAVGRSLRLRPAPPPAADRLRWLLTVALTSGVVLSAARIGLYFGSPTAISQTNDASFHLNALRFAVETGVASPFQLTTMVGAGTFYPSAWHVVGSLVGQLTGADVALAANAVSLMVGAAVWPLGIAFLARAIGGSLCGAVAAAASASIPAFPLLMLQWGVLYPQLLAVALLPVTIATPVLWWRARQAGERGRRRLVALTGVGLAALAVSQPSALLACVVAVFAFAFWEVIGRAPAMSHSRRWLAAAVLTLSALTAAVIWLALGRAIDGTWPPSTDIVTAGVEVVVNGTLGYPWAVGISILMLVGIADGIRRRELRWVVTTWAAFAVLYIVAASVDSARLRAFLVDPWYDDPYRLASLLPVMVLPLAGLGAAAVVQWGARAVGGKAPRGAVLAVAAVIVVGAASIAAAPQIERRDAFTDHDDPDTYGSTADSFLSTDELAVLERLDQTVPADAVVVGNPGTGMSFGFAVSGRNVVPRTWSPPPSAEYSTLWTSLRFVASDPAVCDALDAFGARYVLDFGPGEQYPGRWVMPGFDRLAGQPGFELVDEEGDASLWRVTACD